MAVAGPHLDPGFDSAKTLWIEVGAIDWLIDYLGAQVAEGRTVARTNREKEDDTEGVWWVWRDEAWMARARAPNGEVFTIVRGVKRKLPPAATGDVEEWSRKRLEVYDELHMWRRGVAMGVHVDPAAAGPTRGN